MITRRFTLDFARSDTQVCIKGVHAGTSGSEKWIVTFTNDGEPVTLSGVGALYAKVPGESEYQTFQL